MSELSVERSVERIVIENTKKVRYAELRFGKRTPGHGELIEISAGNDQGKTSLHDGIKSIFEPGKNPSLIRHGCDAAICTMFLSGDVVVRRVHKPKKSEYDITGPDGVEVNSPATYVKTLSRAFAFDPLAFDEAEPTKQLEYLLSITPIEFTPEELSTVVGGTAAKLLDIPSEPLDIAKFGKLLQHVADTRAATGSRRKEKSDTANSLRKGLPSADSGDTARDWKIEAEVLAKRKEDLDRFLQEDIEDIRDHSKPLREVVSGDITRRENEAREALRVALQALANEKYGRVAEIDAAEQKAIEALKEKTATDRSQVAVDLALAQSGAESQIKSQASRELMERMSKEARELSKQYDALQKAADDLKALQTSKLAESFVPGLEVKADGLIYVDGVYWRDLNQAKRFLKAIEIVAQGVGNLGFITCDKGECLDVNSRAVFKRAVEQSGLQVVLFSVATPEQIKQHGPELWSLPSSAVASLEVEAVAVQ